MARRSWSVQDAKNRFSEVVEAARRMPQTVTKHGKPAVVVMDVVEYERLRHLEREHGTLTLLCHERIPPAEHCHRQILVDLLAERQVPGRDGRSV